MNTLISAAFTALSGSALPVFLASKTDGTGSLAVNYLITAGAVVLLVICLSANKYVQKRLGSGGEAALGFTCARCLISTLIVFAAGCIIEKGVPKIEWFSLLIASLVALTMICYTLLGFRILKYGSLLVFTVFLMLGGMMVPYLYGVIMLGEHINAPRVIGLVLMTVSLFLPLIGSSSDKTNGRAERSVRAKIIFGILCFAVFILNGLTSIFTKIHAANVFQQVVSKPIAFVMLCNLMGFVFSGIALIVMILIHKRSAAMPDASGTSESGAGTNFVDGASAKTFAKAFLMVLPAIALASLFDSGSYFLQQLGAAALPASVMYPLLTGGSIVLSAVIGFFFFKEKPSRLALIGLIITFGSTLLFLF